MQLHSTARSLVLTNVVFACMCDKFNGLHKIRHTRAARSPLLQPSHVVTMLSCCSRAVVGLDKRSWAFVDGRRGSPRSCLNVLQQDIEDGARGRDLMELPLQPPSHLW